QLALGNNTNTNTLNQVGTSNNWFLISAGDLHSLAMETSTGVWSAGRGMEGQLGIGTWVAMNTLQSISCPSSTLGNETVSLQENTISIYPNPTNDIVNINYTLENAEKVSLTVTTIQGQTISSSKMDKTSGTNSDSIDLSQQASGMYFITITSESNSFTTKVIKR
ncbi:MAG: T9SS type A sorting domain-containing protein, partial [Anaerolineales bacterium]|nr:T9SS type A sorting domain-containing protein [Anaerolineales bacterium]